MQAIADDFCPDAALDLIGFTPVDARKDLALFARRVHQFVFVGAVDEHGCPLTRLPFREDDPWQTNVQLQYGQNISIHNPRK